MESELAKTLRAMSDDHRMVPDFSEKLLDIADTIERLQKERDFLNTENLRVINRNSEIVSELKRLKVQRDKAMAIGGVNFCAACGDEPVLEELKDSDIPGLGRTFCQKCRVAIGQSDFAS